MSFLAQLNTHMNALIQEHTERYADLTEKWKILDCVIKGYDSIKFPAFRLDNVVLQKKLITTEMHIINSLRMKDVNKYTALLEKYKTISIDLMDAIEDNTDDLVILDGSEKDQAYIEVCNYLKSQVDTYSTSLEILINYNQTIKRCS
jgi:hypothetical protein